MEQTNWMIFEYGLKVRVVQKELLSCSKKKHLFILSVYANDTFHLRWHTLGNRYKYCWINHWVFFLYCSYSFCLFFIQDYEIVYYIDLLDCFENSESTINSIIVIKYPVQISYCLMIGHVDSNCLFLDKKLLHIQLASIDTNNISRFWNNNIFLFIIKINNFIILLFKMFNISGCQTIQK